eukprot:m.124767 g.124767  ORF g.124767 m.124767 type:complete len:205 (+) comp37854_c0_seq5:12290-12904(+)
MTDALNGLQTDNHSLPFFQAVAFTRHGLSVVAQWIGQLQDEPGMEFAKSRPFLELMWCAEQLCTGNADPNIGIFLLKQIARLKGIDALKNLENSDRFQWIGNIVRQYTDESEDVDVDHFVVLDNTYKIIRDAVTLAVLTGTCSSLDKMLQVLAMAFNLPSLRLFQLRGKKQLTPCLKSRTEICGYFQFSIGLCIKTIFKIVERG